jgi:flagellar biosynthesis/type III secretory pathway protein FliH
VTLNSDPPGRDRDAAISAKAKEIVPTSWLDNLLTGPHAVLPKHRFTYNEEDIERLLNAIRERAETVLRTLEQETRSEERERCAQMVETFTPAGYCETMADWQAELASALRAQPLKETP